MLSLVASLFFMSVLLPQGLEASKVTAYQALAEKITFYSAFLLAYLDLVFMRNAALNNERESETDEEQYRAFYKFLKNN